MEITSNGRGERGATTVWFLALVVAMALVVTAVARWGAATATDARAQSVADAVALAAVTGGEGAALQVARRNSARLVRMDETTEGVEVVVEIDGLRATAVAIGVEEADEHASGEWGHHRDRH